MSVRVLESVVSGPLSVVLPDFAEELARQGYTVGSAGNYVGFVADLDRWMASSGVALESLSADVVQAFLAHRRACGYREYVSWKAMGPLLGYLTGAGLLEWSERDPVGPVEVLLAGYAGYLAGERGLAAQTVGGYVRCVRAFVATRVRGDGLDLAGLTAADVSRYVTAVCPGMARGTAKLVVTTLRSLLGWLGLTGQVSAGLAGAVPSTAGWRLSGLPKAFGSETVAGLLGSCDRGTVVGRRDYAVLLLLVRLGLRVGEVCGLLLEDIDWRGGQISVKGKGSRDERLPLPADVGAAIADYLRDGRPPAALDRCVFVRVVAPRRGMSSGAVIAVVRSAGVRAGFGPVAAHRLRHTTATAMLRSGSSLPEVGQVLRHRRLSSTAIYAKVDRDALRALVIPWPVGEHAQTSGGRS